MDRVEPTRGVADSAVASRLVRLSLAPPTDRSACQFVHRVVTRFAETDAMGVIHHGAYAAYLEEARAAFIDAAGHPYREVQDEGVNFTVLELYLSYLRPVRFGEMVDVGMTVGALTRTSFQVGYVLDVDGETRATAASVHAAVDPGGASPSPSSVDAGRRRLRTSDLRGSVLVSYGLPTHRVDRAEEFLAPGAVGELAAAAEAAGFSAVYTTDHPFPGDAWLAHGGHHSLDPLVVLSMAAASTRTIRLHTNLLIIAYRNPFLVAKGVASLDVLSGGRVILGIGVGYLEAEFEAVGASFDDRNDRTDQAIAAMRLAWSGESVTFDGSGFRAVGEHHAAHPGATPAPAALDRREQSPGDPPGGRARRRVVPVPAPRPRGPSNSHRADGGPRCAGGRARVRRRVRTLDREDPTAHRGLHPRGTHHGGVGAHRPKCRPRFDRGAREAGCRVGERRAPR